ncbi:MAG: GAF domain-containing protein [Ardenticatenaceae bacterium]|nr:GAF domain-containing protein [Ardenticatenaceae bacterium]
MPSEVKYKPVPEQNPDDLAGLRPIWQIRLSLVSDESREIALELNDEVILGRSVDEPNIIDLTPFGAGQEGVSRNHLILRPAPTNLFAIDIGSTNGSMRNGRSIGVNTPYPLSDGDMLTLGALQLLIHIDSRPAMHTAPLIMEQRLDLADALTQIAKAITSQLELDDVLNHVVEMAGVLTNAGETAIWLVDEQTGELFLEAERGISDEKIRRMRIPILGDSLAGQVIKNQQSFRMSRQPGEDQIKVKTGYLVEALAYVPITLGGVTFGVLAAGHRVKNKQFNKRDERLLEAIADFAAIAIQNARLFQATDQALARRVQELSALNEVAYTVSSSLDLDRVYDVLVEQVNRNWPVDAVRLHLLNEKKGTLEVLSKHKKQDTTSPLINRGIIWHVAQSEQVFVTNDAGNDPNYAPKIDDLNGEPPHSVASVPLRAQNKVVGVLTLLNKADGPFTDEDVERLKAFANPITTAIQNARLFEDAQRQRTAIQAMARTLSQPIIFMDENGRVLVSNQAANTILDNHMSDLFAGLSTSKGETKEIEIAKKTYLATAQHLRQVGTIIVMQDITYVKQLEQDRAEFMRALSHDLKSPLTSIRGFAQLLKRVMEINERGEQYIEKIVSSSDRMLDMVNQLLQIARSEEIEVERAPCNLDIVVKKALGDVEGSALHKSIHLDYSVDGEPYEIFGDEMRLYHMALNLVDNAIKYSPDHTTITVTLSYNRREVTLQVCDEGQGIAEEDLERVFDKYYRGAKAKAQPGAGVGLSVVAGIADAHGGRATVQNRPEGGAAFSIVLPSSLRVQQTTPL